MVGAGGAAVALGSVWELAGTPYGAGEAPASLDPDALEDVGEEIATLAAHLHAGMRRYLSLVAWFDRNEGWKPAGQATCAHWLSEVTGHDLGTAREHVRVARALQALPETGAAMGRGALSFAQVRALSRVATPENETDLLELAEGCTAAVLERVVRAWKKHDRKDEAEWERQCHASRSLSVSPGDDGMYEVRGRVDPEVGAVLMRALEAASDALYRNERGGGSPPPTLSTSDRDRHLEAARRRADAIGLLAERALAAGFGEDDPDAPTSGSRAERYQVVLYVEPRTLSAEGEPGTSELPDGTRVSAETSRRVACDSGMIRLERGSDGSVLDVGRKTRTIPPALRRALEARDRGCRFPGCGSRFTEAHHVVHWADGDRRASRTRCSCAVTTIASSTRTGGSSSGGVATVRPRSSTRGGTPTSRDGNGRPGSLETPSPRSSAAIGSGERIPMPGPPPPAGASSATFPITSSSAPRRRFRDRPHVTRQEDRRARPLGETIRLN